MKEIKSVRVRRNDVILGTLDIKVTIYQNNLAFGPEERVLVGVNNDRPVWIETTYKKTASYKDYTDDQFIEDFINMNSKIQCKLFYVIQDPWDNKVPIYRDYGSDPYYLNNGAVVYIMWKDGNTDIGGQKYSDDNGFELTPSDISFKKTIKIISSNETQGFTLGKNGDFEYSNNSQEYVSTIKDRDIISEIVSKWKTKVDNYNDLWPCMPIYESCSIIPYKGPLQPIVPTKPVGATAISADSKKKETIKINLQDTVVKVKEDIQSLKVYIGIAKDVALEQLMEEKSLNNEQDDFIDGEGVDYSEYVEDSFIGEEEKWNPIPGIPDDTFDPDTDKGAGGDESPEPQSFVPATQTQKDFIKAAVQATLSKGEKHGKCARFTFNHVNNYIRLIQGKPVEKGDVHNAGGNAKDSGYHKNLQSMGYTKIDYGSITKSDLINKIKTNGWSVGDVIVYWCTDGPSNASHVMYGHTQIFTNGYHNNSSYRWSTDNMNNYSCSFVYRTKPGNTYKAIHFQAPKSKKLNDSV